MSNINCHRRKIIYSVRTLIIALQSWIIRRIHTSMPVFDDIEKNELGVITIAGGSVPSSGSPCGNCSSSRLRRSCAQAIGGFGTAWPEFSLRAKFGFRF